jgi:hypothetical protein
MVAIELLYNWGEGLIAPREIIEWAKLILKA